MSLVTRLHFVEFYCTRIETEGTSYTVHCFFYKASLYLAEFLLLSRKAHGCTQYYRAKRMAVHSIIAQSAWLYTVLSRKAHGCTQNYRAKRMAVHSIITQSA